MKKEHIKSRKLILQSRRSQASHPKNPVSMSNFRFNWEVLEIQEDKEDMISCITIIQKGKANRFF
jgi:hypothetical protein